MTNRARNLQILASTRSGKTAVLHSGSPICSLEIGPAGLIVVNQVGGGTHLGLAEPMPTVEQRL